MKRVLLILIVIISGCAGQHEIHKSPATPQIVRMSGLPLLPSGVIAGQLKLQAYFYVLRDGTVSEVRFMNTSGDADWDMAAADSLRRWRFSTLPDDVPANGTWLRYTVRVEVREPIMMNIGEIIAFTRREADSLYALLQKGTDFDTIARTTRERTTTEYGTYRGIVNIAQYPEHVRKELEKLKVNRFTLPIPVGITYVIFKRFDDRHTELAKNAH